MAVNDVITQTNQKIFGSFQNVNLLNVIGWVVFGIILIGAAYFGYTYYFNKRKFNKIIQIYEIIGNIYEHTMNDTAKVVKIGSGGFEILYLRKLKIWRLAYGGKAGKKTYRYFIQPDGYWYNGSFSSNIREITKEGGLIPIVTTNPLMRSQYTALEKQIDSMLKNKEGFWEKYGTWILSIGFVLVAGMMLWLNYREYVQATANLGQFADKLGTLVDKVNILISNQQTSTGGLIKA